MNVTIGNGEDRGDVKVPMASSNNGDSKKNNYGSIKVVVTAPSLDVMDENDGNNDGSKSSGKSFLLWSFKSFEARRRAKIFLGIVVAVISSLLYFWSRPHARKAVSPLHPSKGTVSPTFLLLRDEIDGTLISAVKNPLYEDLENAVFYYDRNKDIVTGHENAATSQDLFFTAEPLEVQLDQPLLLKWTTNGNNDNTTANDELPVLLPTDVLALYCSDNDDDDHDTLSVVSKINSTSLLLELATVAQIWETHQQAIMRLQDNSDYQESDSELELWKSKNAWYIPSFPVRHFSACRFIFYHSKQQAIAENGPEVVELHYIASTPSIKIHPTTRTQPFGIHLSASEFTSMVVSFATGAIGTPVVKYGIVGVDKGEHQGSLDQVSAPITFGTSTTYTTSDLCMEPANRTGPGKFIDPGMLHTVLMTDLLPNTIYHYQVGLQYEGEEGVATTWSDIYTFQSSLFPGDKSPFSFIVYGDQGCPGQDDWGQGHIWVEDMAYRELSRGARAVHHVGDLSYSRGAGHIWEAWLDMIQPIAARVPYHILVGNHEYDYKHGGTNKDPSHVDNDNGFHPDWGNFGNDSGGECGVPTSKRFTMPGSLLGNKSLGVTASNGVFWYSHDFGLVHTVVVSSEHDMSAGSMQYKWLMADLEAVDRAITPWVILELHRPLYESEKFWDQNAVGIGERYEVEEVLVNYNVDLVLSGHYHAYLRTCDGLVQNRCNSGGPMHITVGTAGANLDSSTLYETTWTARYIQQVYGYGRITVANSTALLFEFVQQGSSDAMDGKVLDHVWLKRDRARRMRA